MIIIAESGATKTAWRAVREDGNIGGLETEGLNPTGLSPEDIQAIIRKAIPKLNPEGRHVQDIFFYGAGLVSTESTSVIADTLGMWCPLAELHFHSDMLAAARALFGDGSGVVAIMGTGSNSCLYEHGKITENIRPGGYILGDEGSGAALGKAFLADFVKGLLPAEVEAEFVSTYGLDYAQIVRKVYKEPAASAFMASFAPFILKHKENEHIKEMIATCIGSFVKRSLARYQALTTDSISARKAGVVGSFGWAFMDFLVEAGKEHGLEFVKFLKDPIDELVKYHMYGI